MRLLIVLLAAILYARAEARVCESPKPSLLRATVSEVGHRLIDPKWPATPVVRKYAVPGLRSLLFQPVIVM